MKRGPDKKTRIYSVEEMLELRRQGVTLREIGERLGVSWQRVQQIVGPTREIKPRKYYPTKEERNENKRKRAVDGFWARVDIKGKDECWNWTGCINKTTGYGHVSVYGESSMYPHRIAYILTNGNIPPDALVLHNCDTPLCCNPNHLRVGAQQENIDDRENRKRGKHRNGSHAFYRARNRNIIKDYRSPDDLESLAEKYGVCTQMIYRIVLRHKHNPGVYDG